MSDILARSHLLCFVVTVLGLSVLIPAPANAKDELPPEVNALITKLREDMKSNTLATRVAAYKALGDLSEKAKGQRRAFCEGMLDPNAMVRIAAADGLKKVDESVYKLALGIIINKDSMDVVAAGNLRADAEPLVPILFAYGTSLAPLASKEPGGPKEGQARDRLIQCVNAMVAIAPEDEGVNKAVINLLVNPSVRLRATALSHVPALKNKKLALQNVLMIAANLRDDPANRTKAVRLVPDLVDDNSSPVAMKALDALRFDDQKSVREAVAASLAKLK
jgi:hypothetical protein